MSWYTTKYNQNIKSYYTICSNHSDTSFPSKRLLPLAKLFHEFLSPSFLLFVIKLQCETLPPVLYSDSTLRRKQPQFRIELLVFFPSSNNMPSSVDLTDLTSTSPTFVLIREFGWRVSYICTSINSISWEYRVTFELTNKILLSLN